MKDKIFKYVSEDDTFIYVVAKNAEIAKQKIFDKVKVDKLTYKYCEPNEEKVETLIKTLERGGIEWRSNTKSIVIY